MSDQQDEEHQRERYSLSGMTRWLINDVRGCPYFILGAKIFCSDDELKKAYRKQSAKFHPDKTRTARKEVQALNEEKQKCINSAKRFLDDGEWKRLYEAFFKESPHPKPFDHSKWSSYLSGKPESSRFTEPPSPQRVHSYEASYDKAKKWIREKVDRKEIEGDEDTVALIIRDILVDRSFHIYEISMVSDEVQAHLKQIRDRYELFENVEVDLVLLKMFECYPHIFPLSCGFALQMLKIDNDQCVEDEKEYVSKWSKITNFVHQEYKEHDFVERNSMNEEITFIIPVFEDAEHWTGIVRRWIQHNLHFFYLDSWDKTVINIEDSTVIKEIPPRILLLLMDSPLWPRGQKAYWTRVPNVKQVEKECGARMLAHCFLVAFSDNPFQTLIPLNYIGQKKLARENDFYVWRSENLANLSRSWVHSIIKDNNFLIPHWMLPVAKVTPTVKDGIFSRSDWKSYFCLEQDCSLEEIIRLSRRLHEEIREKENAQKLASAKKKGAKKKGGSKKKKRTLKKAGEVVTTTNRDDVEVAISKDSSGKGYVDSSKRDVEGGESPVVIEIASDNDDEGEEEELIPIDMQKKEGVYEFEARITDGAVLITVSPVSTEHLPGLYNCLFRGYRQRVDGSIGYIEEHKLIRNSHDILIGLDGVHTKGWTFEKVLERIKKLAKSKPECIITFTFADYCLVTGRQRPAPSPVPNTASSQAAESSSGCSGADPSAQPLDTQGPQTMPPIPVPKTSSSQEAESSSGSAGADPSSETLDTQRAQTMPSTEVQKQLAAESIVELQKQQAADSSSGSAEAAQISQPPDTQLPQTTPPIEGQKVATSPSLVQKMISSIKRFTTSPKRTTAEGTTKAAASESRSADIAAQPTTTEQIPVEPAPQMNTGASEARSADIAAQPTTTEQVSDEPACQTNPEAMAEDNATRPEEATLTDEVINNRHLYGFEVMTGTSLGLRFCPLFEDSSYLNFYQSAFAGYHTVNNTEGYIEKNKLVRSIGDVLIGINRVDLSGWPHDRVQHHIHNLSSDRTMSTIHLTFMDVFRANDLFSQQVTNLEKSNKRKRTDEEDCQLDQKDKVDDEEPGTKSSEAISDVDIEMPLDNSAVDLETTQPPEVPLNTVVVHPAIRDIPEHTELFQHSRESNCVHTLRRYRPVEFCKYVYRRTDHRWSGIITPNCSGSDLCFGSALCFRWMCEYFEDDFIRQCIENADEPQDSPKFSQLYRKEKKIFRLMYDNSAKRWWGYFGQTASEEVSNDWVTENFPEWFIHKCSERPNKKHYIHAGSAKTNTDLTVTGLKPPVFLQNGKHTCVYSSLASGLMYLNDKKASDFVLQHMDLSEEAPDAIGCAIMLLHGVQFKYSAKVYKSGMGALQIFDDISCYPTVVRLKSSDGSAGHCITTVGLWVFDSNKAEAELLSHEFLDWCCSTDTEKDIFVAAHYAVRFINMKPRKEWNLCDACRNGKGKQKCIYKFR